MDVVAERPSLRAGGPDAIADAAHRHVAVIRAGQDLVDRSAARGEDVARQRLRRRARLRADERGREGRRSQHGRDQEDTAADRRARVRHLSVVSIRSRMRCREDSAGGQSAGAGPARIGTSRVPPDHPRPRAAGLLLLAVADAAAHAALLAPHFPTSFTSSTTGHAFSSGVSGTEIRAKTGRIPSARRGPKWDSIRNRSECSRPTCRRCHIGSWPRSGAAPAIRGRTAGDGEVAGPGGFSPNISPRRRISENSGARTTPETRPIESGARDCHFPGTFRLEQPSRVRSSRSRVVGAPLVVQMASSLGSDFESASALLFAAMSDVPGGLFWILGLVALVLAGTELAGLRYIANNRVGIVEKLWSVKGSVPEGRIIALDGEAGFQAEVLRGGLHFGLWRWQYRIHKLPLVAVPQGKIGYVYARDGEALQPSQTLGQIVACNHFQDARRFLGGVATSPEQGPVVGQRGRQRAILREGVYAINLALFTVIAEDAVYRLEAGGSRELKALVNWQNELGENDAFNPVIIGGPVEAPDPLIPDKSMWVDSIGIVTVHDGPSLPPGEIIAPGVGCDRNDKDFHNNYQDPEAFLRGGPAGIAVCPADRRHLFHQPMVRHDRVDPQDARPDRPRRRRGQLLRPERSGRLRAGVPPRRARRRGGAGRAREAAGARQVRLQHLRRQHRPGPHDQLRPALGHRPDRDASIRREPALHRPRHQGRLRADPPALGRRPHRLPEGAERHPAVRRRQEADHPDARPDAQRLLPRRGAQADDARIAPGARRHPARVGQRTRPQVPQLRHRMRGRPDRQAGHGGGGREDRDVAGAVAAATALAGAGGDLRQAGDGGGPAPGAQRGAVQAQMQTQLTNSLVQVRIAENEAEAQLARRGSRPSRSS